MSTVIAHGGLRDKVARAFGRRDAQSVASVPIDGIADVRIPELAVTAALQAITTQVPTLRKFRAGCTSLVTTRKHLVEALNAAHQDAKRDANEVGVRVLEVHGRAGEVDELWTVLAPHVTPHSYVQFGGHYWTFEGGSVVVHQGTHPDINAGAEPVVSGRAIGRYGEA